LGRGGGGEKTPDPGKKEGGKRGKCQTCPLLFSSYYVRFTPDKGEKRKKRGSWTRERMKKREGASFSYNLLFR